MRIHMLIFLIALYFIYLLVGALAFMLMEQGAEKQRCEEAKSAKNGWLAKTTNETGFSEAELNLFIKNVSRFAKFGIILTGEVKCPKNWDFQSAFFFSGTIITTIGYGNISPTLWYSQMFCVSYALIGIPLFAVTFACIGQYFSNLIETFLNKIHKDINPKTENFLKLMIISGGSIVLFHLIPAIVFTHVEGWSYGESVYYCFISLTTIGFGDFVAGNNPRKHYITIYRIMVYFWILFGLAYTFTAIEMLTKDIIASASRSGMISEDTTSENETENKEGSERVGLLNSSEPGGNSAVSENSNSKNERATTSRNGSTLQ